MISTKMFFFLHIPRTISQYKRKSHYLLCNFLILLFFKLYVRSSKLIYTKPYLHLCLTARHQHGNRISIIIYIELFSNLKQSILFLRRQSFATLGLQSSCPSELSFPTKVKFLGKRCYVVQPEKQCVTYAKCSEKS